MTDDRQLQNRAGIAGAVAAAVALGAGELPSALAGEATSLVSVVASRFIDGFAASLKDIAVALFGTNDKIALIVGIVVVGVLAGFLLGRLALRSFAYPVAGFAAFGAVGSTTVDRPPPPTPPPMPESSSSSAQLDWVTGTTAASPPRAGCDSARKSVSLPLPS